VADLHPGNPGLEVAVASRDKLYVWDAQGELLSGFPVTWQDELRSLAAGDIDDDGDLELVVATTQVLEALMTLSMAARSRRRRRPLPRRDRGIEGGG
jgi:hypothetical protein